MGGGITYRRDGGPLSSGSTSGVLKAFSKCYGRSPRS